jgi:hypothetical protein
MEIGFDWRRERVGRTLTTVEAGAEKERVHGVDLTAVGEAVGDAGMDPTAVGEAVDVASRQTRSRSEHAVWTRRRSGRRSTRRRWCRCGDGRGAGAWVAGK